MAELLFVYGTLIPGCEPAGMSPVCQHMRVVGEATVLGRLYDVGEYPAAVLTDAPVGATIRGMLVGIDDEGAWRDLDRYEGCPADRKTAGLFRRVRTLATLADGTATECWIYVYNRDLHGARPIAGGCWRSRGVGTQAGAGISNPPANR